MTHQIVMSIVGPVENCATPSKCHLYSMAGASIVDIPATMEVPNLWRHALSVNMPSGFHCIMCGYTVRVKNGEIIRPET